MYQDLAREIGRPWKSKVKVVLVVVGVLGSMLQNLKVYLKKLEKGKNNARVYSPWIDPYLKKGVRSLKTRVDTCLEP